MARRTLEELAEETKRRSGQRRKKQTEPADWGVIDGDIIKGFVEFAQRVDGAVRFGRSRDGSVYSIGFYIGEERFTEWIRHVDGYEHEFQRLLQELCEDYGL